MNNTVKLPGIEYEGEKALEKVNQVLNDISNLLGYNRKEIFIDRIVLVLDSSFAFNDLLSFLFTKRSTDLQLCLKYDLVTILAPIELKYEFQKNVTKLSKSSGFTISELQNAWENYYTPFISYVGYLPEESSELLDILVDKKDEAFVQSYEAFNADGVLSQDKHIKVLNIVPRNKMQFIVDIRRYHQLKSIELQMTYLGMNIGIIGVQFIFIIIKSLIEIAKKYPFAVALIAGAIFIYGSTENGKKRIREFTKDIFDFLDTMSELDEIKHITGVIKESQNQKRLLAAQIPVKKPIVYLKSYIRRGLIEINKPVTLDEIIEKVTSMGYASRSKHFNQYVTKTLRSMPELIQNSDHTWWLKQL